MEISFARETINQTKVRALTSEGRAIREEAKPGWQAAQEKVAKALGAPDNAMLAATIDRLIEELND